MMFNSVAVSALRQYFLLPEVHIPTHRVLQTVIDVNSYVQTVRQYVRPWTFPFEKWSEIEPHDEEVLALEALLLYEQDWRKAEELEDVEGMWAAWVAAAEEYLGQRSGPAILPENLHKHKGRSRCRRPVERFIAAKQWKDTTGATNLYQRRLQGMVRRSEELYRYWCQRKVEVVKYLLKSNACGATFRRSDSGA